MKNAFKAIPLAIALLMSPSAQGKTSPKVGAEPEVSLAEISSNMITFDGRNDKRVNCGIEAGPDGRFKPSGYYELFMGDKTKVFGSRDSVVAVFLTGISTGASCDVVREKVTRDGRVVIEKGQYDPSTKTFNNLEPASKELGVPPKRVLRAFKWAVRLCNKGLKIKDPQTGQAPLDVLNSPEKTVTRQAMNPTPP